jgi:hypothetical protein
VSGYEELGAYHEVCAGALKNIFTCGECVLETVPRCGENYGSVSMKSIYILSVVFVIVLSLIQNFKSWGTQVITSTVK